MKLDILAIMAHPDDVELCCSGTLLRHISMGHAVGIVDLTQGELGTRGNAELRMEEAENARILMGAKVRYNLGLPDGFFDFSIENKRKIVEKIRLHQPDIVITNAVSDRHPDHGRGSKLVSDACFLSGLEKFLTLENDMPQTKWRPRMVFHGIQDRYTKPDFLIDISEWNQKKMDLILAFKSQFYDPNSDEADSPISGKDFLDFLEARSREFGRLMGVEFAEGFTVERIAGVQSLFDLI